MPKRPPQLIADDIIAYCNGKQWEDYSSCTIDKKRLRFQYRHCPYLQFRVVHGNEELIVTDNVAKALKVWEDA